MRSLDDPSTLEQWLKERGLCPKRSLGQHFLVDASVIDQMLTLANLEAGSCVIEIGPGPGVLTQRLLALHHHVIAIELDDLLMQHLTHLQGSIQRKASGQEDEGGRLDIIHANALNLSWHDLLTQAQTRQLRRGANKAVVISNLPYHISTPILHTLLPLGQFISHLVLMVQSEFARRLMARPGASDRSPLSVLAEHYSQVKGYFDVDAASFLPPPRVGSTVIRLDLTSPASPFTASGEEGHVTLEKIVTCGFNQRRKRLRNSLSGYVTCTNNQRLNQILSQRPQELSYEQWYDLCILLSPPPPLAVSTTMQPIEPGKGQ